MANENNIDTLVKEEQRKYYREWRAKNKEKVREINKRYWEKRAKSMLEENKQ